MLVFGFLDIYFCVANENVLTLRSPQPPAHFLYSSAESGERTRDDTVTYGDGSISEADHTICFSPHEPDEADAAFKPVFLFIGICLCFLGASWQLFETEIPRFFVT